MTIFVDTSALYAILNAKDEHHASAATVFNELSRHTFLTHNYVVTETTALLHRRFGKQVASDFITSFAPALDTLWVDADLHLRAARHFARQQTARPSFTDVVSFEVIDHLAPDYVFAFDRDFENRGFRLLPL